MANAVRVRVEVKPALLRWARDRAGMQLDDLARRFPRLARWESGEARPTRKQLERFAKATHTRLRISFEPVKAGQAVTRKRDRKSVL